MKGIVEIKKVYSDGREELVAYDDNVLSVNLSKSIVNLFTNNIGSDYSNLLVGYFQVGKGSHDIPPDPSQKHVYTLEAPLNEADYGASTTLQIDDHDQVFSTKGNFITDGGTSTFKGTFAELGNDFSTRFDETSVHYSLNIGEQTANGQSIKEFGLFSRNPNNFSTDRSSLVAYKFLDEAIEKSDLFSIVIDWQVKFVDGSNELAVEIGSDGEAGAGFNVVLIMADDLGIDQLGIYDSINPYDLSCPGNANANPFSQVEDPVDGCGIYPHTPTLSAMAAGGVTFFNARANTMCSPTRSNILTGKNAFSSPQYPWEDPNTGELRYKGFWGHGIGTVATQSFQKLRGGLRGLGATYTYKNSNSRGLWNSTIGASMNISFDLLGGGTGTDPEVRKTWLSSWVGQDLDSPLHALGYIPANFTILPSLIRNTDFMAPGGKAYKSAIVGKWHLAEWDDLMVYYEDGSRKMGNGWKHIRGIGQWDYARAMFANLDRVPFPGHPGDNTNLTSAKVWKTVHGSNSYDLSDANMGYINYFQYMYDGLDSGTSSILTVSDTGYTTFIESGEAANRSSANFYQQGDASSYATAKTFADASSLYNSLEEPFFLYIPLNTPHAPWTYPPSGSVYNSFYADNHVQKIYETTTGGLPASATWVNHNAMVENMDYCLSGFLDNINATRKERTVFIFQGDNGTPELILDDAHAYASATQAAHGLGTLSGLGPIYQKLITPQYFPETSAGLGGNDDTAARFKASCYDRGVLIPYIVSASFLSETGVASTSSNAFIDVVDVYNTIADIAGIKPELRPHSQQTATDGISFLPVLRGSVDASGHARQFSFFETFRPIGGSVGKPAGTANGNHLPTGTATGYIGEYSPITPTGPAAGTHDPYPWSEGNNFGASSVVDISVEKGYTPDGKGLNTTPYERRRGFVGRFSATVLGAQVVNNNSIDQSTADYSPVLETSAGMYKLIRPTKGSSFDELYFLKNSNFEDVDPYELNDLIPSSYKGSATTPIANFFVNDATMDYTDAANTKWSLLKIYVTLSLSLQYYLQFRTKLPTQVNSIYSSLPEAAERDSIPNVETRVEIL